MFRNRHDMYMVIKMFIEKLSLSEKKKHVMLVFSHAIVGYIPNYC